MGLLDDLLYNASPDNGPGLLGYLTNGRTAHVSDDSKSDLAGALGLNDIGSTSQNVDPNNSGMTNAPASAPAPGAPGAPSVPISTSNYTPPMASPVTAPQFGANASPYLFPQSSALFGGNLPAPAAPAVPPAVANANASAADDDDEDTPAAAPAAQASPIAVGGYQMPRIGPAAAFTPPPAAAPTAPAPAPVAAAPDATPSLGDHLKASWQSMRNGGGLIGGISAAITGQRDDPVATMQATQAAQQNVTAQALLAKGVDPKVVAAAVQPGNGEMLKALLPVLSPAAYTQETDKDGNVWNVNKQTGQKTVALQAKDDKFTSVKTKDALGNETERPFNSKTGEYGAPIADASGTGAPGVPGFGSLLAQGATYDPNKVGDDYMAQFSPEVQAAAKAYINGDVMPTGNPRKSSIASFAKTVATKWGADMGIPVSDATYGAKRTMQNQLASSSNSSMGGILSNGESSFSHLAEATNSMVDMGNSSHDFPLGGVAAHVQNWIKNSGGGSDQDAKVGALRDNLGKYGAESTKFYAGTGGGVEERTAARKDVDPTTVSGEEMASFAEKEKSLMLDRLNTKFEQIRNTLGEERGNAEIAKQMPGIRKNIATIDANIARLRGQAPDAAAPVAPAPQGGPAPGAYAWTPNKGLVKQ